MSPCEVYTDGLTLCRPNPKQPAIMWVERVDLGSYRKPDIHTLRHQIAPFDFVWCNRCHKQRWAARCDVLGGGWYDPQFYCAPGYGCTAKAMVRLAGWH